MLILDSSIYRLLVILSLWDPLSSRPDLPVRRFPAFLPTFHLPHSPSLPPFSLASTVSICRLSFDTQIRSPSRTHINATSPPATCFFFFFFSPNHLGAIPSTPSNRTATASFPPFPTLLVSLSCPDHVRLFSHIDSPSLFVVPRIFSPHPMLFTSLHRLSRRWTSGRRVFGWPMIFFPSFDYPCYFYHQSTTLFFSSDLLL